MDIKTKIAQRKQALLTAAEYSDTAIDQLAKNELAEDSIKILDNLCTKMDQLLKSSGVGRDWKVAPAYAYGNVNGQIARFIQQWVYLPDTLKSLLEVAIPTTAFTSQSIDSWGKLTRCTPAGTILEQVAPNLTDVSVQVEVLRAYLDLPFTEPVLTQAQWDEKEAIAKTRATKKAAEIETALLQDQLDRELGLPTFTI
jgi:hypothetical protein